MNIEEGTKEDYRRQIFEFADANYANHALTVEQGSGPVRMYYCGKPGSGNHSFRVVCAYRWISIFGDTGEMILETSVNSNDLGVERWICDAARSSGYVAEKMRTKPERVLLLGEVAAYIAEMDEADQATLRDVLEDYADDDAAICKVLYDATGDSEFLGSVTDEDPVVYQMISALRRFASLYTAHAKGITS